MTIVVNEKRWEVHDLQTLLTSDAAVLRGCERCASTCTGYGDRSGLCKCCRTRSARYGERAGHVTLMPIERFRARMKEAA